MSNMWIELGLSRADRSAPAAADPAGQRPNHPPLGRLAADLLEIVAASVPDAPELGTGDFRRQVAGYVARLTDETSDITTAFVEEVLTCCRSFIEKAHKHLTERETEFSDLIHVLADMMGSLDGSHTGFTAQLDRSAERLGRMVDINDIRILKRRLELEVEAIRKLSADKRASDEALRAHFSGEIERLQIRLAQSVEEASLDQLTRVGNRGRFERTLRQWVRSHRTTGVPFVLAMVDVDDFKQINDSFGHLEGDRVLSEIARTLATGVRSTDLVARYGGDEFVVMLSHSTAGQSMDRLRSFIETLSHIPMEAPSGAPLTLSVGATEWDVDDEPEEMVARADAAMYQAKRNGKNRVEVVRRPAKSRLFQNGRPIAGGNSTSKTDESKPEADVSALRTAS
jgi:diguanylate cyclase (GGDEF)-like protein